MKSLVFDRSPKSLDEHIISPSAPSVHAQLAALTFHGLDKGLGRKLATLVGVDNLRFAVVPKGLFQHIHGMTGSQRDGDLGGQDFATGPIDYGSQVRKAFTHRDICRVQGPHLISPINGDAAQQVRINLVPWRFLAGIGLAIQRFDAVPTTSSVKSFGHDSIASALYAACRWSVSLG